MPKAAAKKAPEKPSATKKVSTQTQPRLPRAKRDEFLRHVAEDEEDSFIDRRESQIMYTAPTIRGEKPGKGKRSVEDMIASMPNELAQCLYALERVAGLEDQVSKIISLCSPEARELIYKQRPSLRHYGPEEEG